MRLALKSLLVVCFGNQLCVHFDLFCLCRFLQRSEALLVLVWKVEVVEGSFFLAFSEEELAKLLEKQELHRKECNIVDCQ